MAHILLSRGFYLLCSPSVRHSGNIGYLMESVSISAICLSIQCEFRTCSLYYRMALLNDAHGTQHRFYGVSALVIINLPSDFIYLQLDCRGLFACILRLGGGPRREDGTSQQEGDNYGEKPPAKEEYAAEEKLVIEVYPREEQYDEGDLKSSYCLLN